MIAISDSPSPQYPTPTKFMEAMAGCLNLELKRRGYSGAFILDFRWDEREGAEPIVTIVVGPGQAPLTVDRLRDAYEALMKRRGEAEAA
ncbi:MAG: hypothetical protein RLO21_13765 [Nitratireductor sp.]